MDLPIAVLEVNSQGSCGVGMRLDCQKIVGGARVISTGKEMHPELGGSIRTGLARTLYFCIR